MTQILDGKVIRDKIREELRLKIKDVCDQGFVKPSLAIVQIGNNNESEVYIKYKKEFGEQIGVNVLHIHVPESISEEEVLKEIKNLNDDDSVHGILIQLPFPKHLDHCKDFIIDSIHPEKDVDGLSAYNIKKLWIGKKDAVLGATTRGILTMLDFYKIDPAGKHIVIVGRSALVGKPTAMALTNMNATVTLCHSGTVNLEYHTLAAHIIICAVGRPRFITEHHVRPGQVVIDVGINVQEVPNGAFAKKTVGDVDFSAVSHIVSDISPVPGGVGPLTVASLFENVFDAYLKKLGAIGRY